MFGVCVKHLATLYIARAVEIQNRATGRCMNHSCLVFRRLGVGGIGEDGADEQMEGDGGGIRGRCIPGRKKQPPHK